MFYSSLQAHIKGVSLYNSKNIATDISSTQVGFISRREVVGNVTLDHALVKGYNRKYNSFKMYDQGRYP